ncbi:MAG: glycoside hydrolase family 38 C-terminal domain-containing protein, partial [Anaerolineae bacterium]
AAEGEIPVLVYNPHPFPVDATVVCEFQLADQNWEDVFTQVTMTQDDEDLPTQVEKEMGNINLDWRKRVVFTAHLAPGQMSRFDGRLEVLPEKPSLSVEPEDGVIHFRTSDLDVVINTATGLIDRYRIRGVDYVTPGAFGAKVMRDNEDPWGMLVKSFRDIAGTFELMEPEESAAFSGVRRDTLPPVRVVEDGPVRTVVEAVFAYRNSVLVQRYLLPKRGTELGLETRVQWAEKDRLLKLAIPTPMTDGHYVGQVAYGAGDLPSDGAEAVAQKWSAVVGGDDRALTCIDDGIYGSDFSDGELRLSLLRSPAYAGHPIGERPVVPQDRFTPRIDQGERQYRFWFNGGPKRERLVAIDREALVKNEEPFALSFFPHGGGVSVKAGPLLDDEAVQLTAFKRAEDSQGYILRLYEPTGTPRVTKLTLPALGLSTQVRMEGFEVKTLRVDPAAATFVEVDLTESEVQS